MSREKGGRELSPLSFLSHPGSLQRRRAQSRVGVSWGRSQAALLVPAGMACPVSLLPGGRKASKEQCQTGLEACSETRGLSWKEERRELQIYYSKVQGCSVTG